MSGPASRETVTLIDLSTVAATSRDRRDARPGTGQLCTASPGRSLTSPSDCSRPPCVPRWQPRMREARVQHLDQIQTQEETQAAARQEALARLVVSRESG